MYALLFFHRRFTIAVSSTFFLFLNINFRCEIITFRLVSLSPPFNLYGYFLLFWGKFFPCEIFPRKIFLFGVWWWKFICQFLCFSWELSWVVKFTMTFFVQLWMFVMKICSQVITVFHKIPRVLKSSRVIFMLFHCFLSFIIALVDDSSIVDDYFVIYVTNNLSSIASKFDQSIDISEAPL